MGNTREELQRMLHELDAGMPRLMEEHRGEADFRLAFNSVADRIREAAGPGDVRWVSEQLNGILNLFGKSPRAPAVHRF